MAMSEAFKKVDEYRDQVNAGREKLMADDLSCVVYLYERNEKPCVIAYRGRAKKSVFCYRYDSVGARAKKVSKWMDEQQEQKTESKKQTSKRELKVDQILSSSWGYEQTNVNYYLVTALVGKVSVEVVEIGKSYKATGDMTGRCIPDPSNRIGEPMKRRVIRGVQVKINSSIRPSLKVPEIVDGCEIYSSDYVSSYA